MNPRCCFGGVLMVLMCLAGGARGADDAAAKATALKLAKEVGDHTVGGQIEKLIDLTYDTVVEVMGGREAAIKVITEGFKNMKAQGIAVTSLDIGEAGELATEGKNTFIIVPTKLRLSAPKAKILAESYLLGISSDAGKSWKFVDGAGLQDQATKAKVLPKLPEKFTLPEPKKPQVTAE